MRCNGPTCVRSATSACARCRIAVYCGKECQGAAWPTHFRVCRAPTLDAELPCGVVLRVPYTAAQTVAQVCESVRTRAAAAGAPLPHGHTLHMLDGAVTLAASDLLADVLNVRAMPRVRITAGVPLEPAAAAAGLTASSAGLAAAAAATPAAALPREEPPPALVGDEQVTVQIVLPDGSPPLKLRCKRNTLFLKIFGAVRARAHWLRTVDLRIHPLTLPHYPYLLLLSFTNIRG